jgi:hypothetical protein
MLTEMKRTRTRFAGALLCAVGVLCGLASGAMPADAATLEEAIGAGEAGNREAVAAQEQIEAVSDEADRLAAEYRRALQETDSLRLYNGQLQELLDSQEKEVASLDRQIRDIDVVERRITPLMADMIDVLEKFVALDVPFLPRERRERVDGLRAMMKRADVNLSEKYRRLMEAYQVENEYGRTIEAYRATLDAFGTSRTVDFLRLGRVVLLYQTLDTEESGRWDVASKSWVKLSDEYRRPIQQGLRIARKQTAPDLIRVPVPAPEESK